MSTTLRVAEAHTVWNVHNERAGGRYVVGEKRRPRSAWEIRKGTHEALISDDEAEAILKRLEEASSKLERRTAADYLFTGLLKTSDGAPWYGDKQRYYRAGNAHVAACEVDNTIIGKMADDLRSSAFSDALVRKARSSYGREFNVELERLSVAEAGLNERISRFMDMAEKLESPEPVLRKVEELERDRKRIAREVDQARRDAATAAAARGMTGEQVNRMLDAMRATWSVWTATS